LNASEKKYFQPKTVAEALQLASANISDFKYIAGGTDILVNRFQGNEGSSCLIDITGIDELGVVNTDNENLHIGALVKLSELKAHLPIRKNFPAVIEAANLVGSPLIRNSATIGGNLLCDNRCVFYNQSEWWREGIGFCLKCNGSTCIVTGTDKACYSECISDTAPALISMDAKIQIVDVDGEKTLPVENIYTGDGINPVNLNRTAIVKSIVLPLGRGFRSVFKKLRQRDSLEYTSLSSSVSIDKNENLKIAMTGIDPKPVVVCGTSSSDREILIKKAISGSRSVDNTMLSRKYRKDMIRVFLRESFAQLLN